MMGGRTDTNEMEMIPGMNDHDDVGGYFDRIQRPDDFDPEAFRRKHVAYLTAVVVYALVIAAVVLTGVGVVALILTIL